MRHLETLIPAVLGGFLFQTLNLPLPWMLGPLTAVLLYQESASRPLLWSPLIKQLGLIVLGISFGLYFQTELLMQITTYFAPYILMTTILLSAAVSLGLLTARLTGLSRTPSVFGAIPGGLTEMVIASEELKAQPQQVLIFQTVRLVVVLFTVPALMIYLFTGSGTPEAEMPSGDGISFFSPEALLFLGVGAAGFLLQRLLPAGIMIIPLLLTVVLMISPVMLPAVPELLFYSAQLAVGVSLGISISFSDIRKAGSYSLYFALIAFLLIALSMLLGLLLAWWTGMEIETALLSTAPGGIVEMVLTASVTGADPAVVTSLQLLRVILIVTFVPPLLKKMFYK
ncbi:AbrB family transcriptional regulator [Alkalicoccus chagannorensis]|uniref:AbrB family transcriptional regulator n=1 Tax=Alkalicoccus chagannorensis TaxID=427072 RepID=UPI0004073101|nr:AbrB family transcriptional regulator [Alkalicoccus chagannorensis]